MLNKKFNFKSMIFFLGSFVWFLCLSLFPPGTIKAQDESAQQACLPSTEDTSPLIHSDWDQLVLKSKDLTIQTKASNYLLDESGKPWDFSRSFASLILKRDPAFQWDKNQELTEDHARHEMSFKVKDEQTGLYNKFSKVAVNGVVVPFPKEHFDQLVQSTGPIMRALRRLLQKVYSLPEDQLTAKNLELEDLPLPQQTAILEAIKGNIYYNKKMHHPSLIAYPFLSIAGFDAAISHPKKVDATFFEYNLGTPSGLSNNIQLLQSLSEKDPQLYQALLPQLSQDTTFSQLRKVVEDNALSWTGNAKGISVMVGPGPLNGAHPDVASIALMSGMPLVQKKDLYLDKKGNVRLNTGKGNLNPVVTGIYNRAEEAFLQGPQDDGVVVISPSFKNNVEIGKLLGVELQPGAEYEFIFGKKTTGETDYTMIIGVQNGKDGLPLSTRYWEELGKDPTDPYHSIASTEGLLQAVQKRKLYVSNLGGRTVDDKKIFQILHDSMAGKFKRLEDKYVAHPPQTLKTAEFERFYEAGPQELKNFVVKITDSSGGDGVHILANLPESEATKVVQMVKEHPEKYIVQEFKQVAVMSTPHKGEGEKIEFRSQANDWRIFPMMDSKGNIHGSVQSILLRNATVGNAKTNTSAGGGYGIGVILEDRPKNPLTSILPVVPQHPHLSESKRRDLEGFLEYLNQVTEWAIVGPSLADVTIDKLTQKQRNVMDVLGRDYSLFMSDARDLKNNKISLEKFTKILLAFRNNLMESDPSAFPVAGVSKVIHQYLGGLGGKEKAEVGKFCDDLGRLTMDIYIEKEPDWAFLWQFTYDYQKILPLFGEKYAYLPGEVEKYKTKAVPFSYLKRMIYEFRNDLYREKNFQDKGLLHNNFMGLCLNRLIPPYERTFHTIPTTEELEKNLTFFPLADPVVTRTYLKDGSTIQRMELGVYQGSTDPFIQQVIDNLKLFKGELKKIRDFDVTKNEWCPLPPSANFLVSEEEGIPQICIDFTAPYALTGLAHENEHFVHWDEKRKLYLAEEKSEIAARIMAKKLLLEPLSRILDEKRAVAAEMKMGKNNESLFNRGYYKLAADETDIGYISLHLYPEIEGVRDMFHRYKWSKEVLDTQEVWQIIKELLISALKLRKKTYDYHKEKADRHIVESDLLESAKSLHYANQVYYREIFDLVFRGTLHLFRSNLTQNLLVSYIQSIVGASQGEFDKYKLDSNDPMIFFTKSYEVDEEHGVPNLSAQQ